MSDVDKDVEGLNAYQTEALRTAGGRLDVVMSALGLAGEAGEYVEKVKKRVFHDRDIPASDFISELGDVLWYVAYAAACQGCTLQDVANANVRKLRARYPAGSYSHDQANAPRTGHAK